MIKKPAKKLFGVLCGFFSRPKKDSYATGFSSFIYYSLLNVKINRESVGKVFFAVILSVAKNLGFRIIIELRDSSSLPAPQNDNHGSFSTTFCSPNRSFYF